MPADGKTGAKGPKLLQNNAAAAGLLAGRCPGKYSQKAARPAQAALCILILLYPFGRRLSRNCYNRCRQGLQPTGRRVVLLMVGDHAPYLVDELTDSALTGAERTIRQRATPFVLWTNYPAETRVTTGTAGDALPVVDLCALLPMAAEQAGLPLSPYYRYLLAMRQEVSGWTNLDGVLLPDGSVAADGTSAEADAWVSGYYMLEYNALTASERVESLFLPETG